MGWGLTLVGTEVDTRIQGRDTSKDLTLELRGPYGTCRVSNELAHSYFLGIEPIGMAPGEPGDNPTGRWLPGEVGAEGPLPFTNRDDCLIRGGDGREPNGGGPTGELWLLHPYLDGQRQAAGAYTLNARWSCVGGGGSPETTCTANRLHQFILGAGPRLPHRNWLVPIAPADTRPSLPRNAWVPLVRFEVTGECTWLPTNQDCSF
jgi:hypothetical protein